MLHSISEDEEDEEHKDSWFFCSTKAAKELLGEKCRHKDCVLPCDVEFSTKGDDDNKDLVWSGLVRSGLRHVCSRLFS